MYPWLNRFWVVGKAVMVPNMFIYLSIFYCLIYGMDCKGHMLLYRPKDITKECTFSTYLRFDISFGMGMSDTITLVFRTLSEIDYSCLVEIVTDASARIVIVIKFPTILDIICTSNKDVFTVVRKNKCIHLCDKIDKRSNMSTYFVAAVEGRLRFSFLSNSSVNSNINAYMYQVTATAARVTPHKGCTPGNETMCTVHGQDYCMTSGIVCDGINNCGVQNWFDENKSECGLVVEKLGFAPVIAIVAALFCALLAAAHILLRCLPPLANSFFIFNANEDNRLCINPVCKPISHKGPSIEKVKRMSLIPVSLTSSCSSSEEFSREIIAQTLQSLSISGGYRNSHDESPDSERVMARRKPPGRIRSVAERIHSTFWKDKNRMLNTI